MKSFIYLCFVLLFIGKPAISSNDTILLNKIESIAEVSEKVKFLLLYSQENGSIDLNVLEKSLQLADSIIAAQNLEQFTGELFYQKGNLYFNKGYYKQAKVNLLEAEKYFINNNNLPGIAKTYNKLGTTHISQAEFPEALDYFIKSLNIKDSIGDDKGFADSYANIGNVLFEMNDVDQALEYYQKSIEIDKRDSNELGMAKTIMNIGLVYKWNFEYDDAIKNFEESLVVFFKYNDSHQIANCYSNMALVYSENNNGDKALTYFNKALAIYEKAGAEKGMASMLSNIGYYYSLQGDYEKAVNNLKRAIRIAQSINSIQDVEITSQALSDAYQRLGNYKEAYNYYVLFKNTYDKLNDDKNTRAFTQMEMNFEFEQEKKDIEFKQQQIDAEHRAEIKRQRLILLFIILGALALLVFAVYMYRNYQQKKKDNELLKTQKEAIEKQRDKIDKQNTDITDSIKYAKRIQTALLPPDEMLDKLLINYFVLYKPRDIVSGDYYWAYQKDNKSIIVAADCTGHGVPGAFMSMLGMSFLNEIIQQEKDISSNTILNKLREYVIRSMRQTGKVGEAQDGMDLSMVIIDRDNKTLQFSGAYNSLLLIRDLELIQYKADKMPIGISIKSAQPFTNQIIDYKENDTIYLLSDGYVDQFGGPKNQKYKSRPFKELLLTIQDKTMIEQKEILDSTIEEWKGDYEQIDDILVIGIRL